MAGLDSRDPARRASAEARLNLLGGRVVAALEEWLPRATTAGRAAALRVLEGIDLPAARSLVRGLARDAEPGVAGAALAQCGVDPGAVTLLGEAVTRGPDALRRIAAVALGSLAREGDPAALERLAELASDPGVREPLRRLALDALPADTRRGRSLVRRLRPGVPGGTAGDDWSALVAARPPADALARAVRRLGQLDPPARLAALAPLVPRWQPGPGLALAADALAETGSPAAIPVLHRLVSRLPTAERATAAQTEAAAAVHLALARLGSRIALYDLRERLEHGPVAPRLVEAAAGSADASLLGALGAFARRAPAHLAACRAAVEATLAREGRPRCLSVRRRLGDGDRAALEAVWPRARSPRRR